MTEIEKIKAEAATAVKELIEIAKPVEGSIFVIGCSSSEVIGEKIGSNSSVETAQAIFDAVYPVVKGAGLYLAAQCCEHLNRAIIVEQEVAEKYSCEQVNVVPQPKAGGSFATAAYKAFEKPCAVEQISASCGIDIGGTLIGMHIKRVAVPVRLSVKMIGEANIICARSRAKFIGGSRACYDETLL